MKNLFLSNYLYPLTQERMRVSPFLIILSFPLLSLNLIMLNVKKGKTHGCVYEHFKEEEKKVPKSRKFYESKEN